jgi:hypothetical protein
MKLLPLTVSVKADPPALVKLGDSELAIGAGFAVGVTLTGALVAALV